MVDTSRTAEFMLQDAVRDVLRQVDGLGVKIMRRVGNRAKKRVKEAAPKGETLRLSNSATSRVKDEGKNNLSLEVGVTDQKGHLFELGTVKMSPRPFVGPATKDLPQELEAELVKEGKKLKGIK